MHAATVVSLLALAFFASGTFPPLPNPTLVDGSNRVALEITNPVPGITWNSTGSRTVSWVNGP
jgi:hypothetical protein